MDSPIKPSPDRHVWEFQWVRDLAWLVALAAVTLVAYAARAVVVPVLLGLALAYVFNPLVTWLKTRWRVPRWVSTVAIESMVILAVLGMLAYTVPKLIGQIRRLLGRLPEYFSQLARQINPEWQTLVQDFNERFMSWLYEAAAHPGEASGNLPDADFGRIGAFIAQSLLTGFNVVGSAIGLTTYLAMFVVVVLFCFFFFCWKFEGIREWFKQFLPRNNRERFLEVAGKMDHSVSAFLRGRLIQALVVGVVLSSGWAWAGVPYWLILGMGAGLLNLIPYAAVVGWPLAILLKYVDDAAGGTGFSFWAVIFWPSIVYFFAQGLDGWVVEPLVQGKATNLDPLTVLLAVLIGGSVAGLLGMILAIPVAACIKILSQEVIIPRLREYLHAQ